MNTIKGWWFSEGYKLPHEDNRIIKIGKTHKIKGKIIPCTNGLHASERIIDALGYAPGPIIWKVELSGTVIKEGDKICASSRKYIAGGVDCSEVLRKFTRLCALEIVANWDAPQVVIDYLKTGDEAIRPAARSAAWAAAWPAARFTAWSEVRPTAWAAAWAAARFASESAAWSEAEFAVARGSQNKLLTKLINQLMKKGL
jgi:hypothetical protein